MPTPDPAVFTIPSHRAFADALAAGLIVRSRGDPLALARTVLLLPNRRAATAMTAAFVRASADGGVLLPRLVPVADLDDADALGAFADPAAADTPPPAIAPLARQLRLGGLLRSASPGLGAADALRLAGQLGRAVDTLDIEETPRSALRDFIDGDLARHQQAALAALQPLLDLWPGILSAEGLSDPASRRVALLRALTARWALAPPATPVVAAGIVAAPPAVAQLLAVVARLPDGVVVLPGLDAAMAEAEWQALRLRAAPDDEAERGRDAEDHPQHALKLLLHRMRVERGEVRAWPTAPGATSGPLERDGVVAEAMALSAFTGCWRTPAMLPGVRTLVAAAPAEEAQAIALVLREALEVPGRTAALITPDRTLARRVAAHLRRWEVDVDDSAGAPLALTPPAALCRVAAEAAAARFAPVQLLALLKHPLVRAGDKRLGWLDAVRGLDRALRGVRPVPGLAGVAERLRADAPALLGWWRDAATLLRPLADAFGRETIGMDGLADGLRDLADALAGEAAWRGAAGRALADWLDAVAADGARFGPLAPAEAPGLLAALMDGVTVREPFGKSARVAILGLLEARLQRFDLAVLGGLNEGVWPARPTPDPWLPPALRRAAGLPGERYGLGLAAHDFVQALGGPEVVLTRARRDDTAPTVASRLWLRLEARLGDALVHDDALLAHARALDACAAPAPAPRPAPAPPAALRPRRISVTAAEQLRADPYSFYARHVLHLRRLDDLDQEPTGAEKGIDVHAILEAFVEAGDDDDPARLRALADAHLAKWRDHPRMRALWTPRVHRALDWAAGELARRRAEGWSPLAVEADGALALAGGVTLTGKADRIDRRADGALAIVDYKTGTLPSRKAVTAGFAIQLGLLGRLAEAGVLARGARKLAAGPVVAFELWKLGGGAKEAGRTKNLLRHYQEEDDPADHIACAVVQLDALVDGWLVGTAPFTAKLHPDYAERYTEYDQLARLAEWRNRSEAPA